jgi:serine/threonine protein kinase
MSSLARGKKIPLEAGGEAEVIEEIGSGGQGTVYKVSLNGKEYALKWYALRKLKSPDEFCENLRQNIHDGPPSEDFLWPKYLTKTRNENFGYLMELRPKKYSDFSASLNKKKGFRTLHEAVLCALNIVNNFRALHRQGKSYQDLNDGNFFVDTETGNVLICDNDNVAPDKTNLGIVGKPGYMAPEIVRGEARPDTLTDAHSLAVVLFKLFMRHDPLMGKKFVESVCITEEADKRLYGDSPLFIFDPVDKANAPVPGVHPNPINLWPYYPDYIQEAFIQSFCDGLKAPTKRLTENDWQNRLVRLRGEILTCVCGGNFFASHVKQKVRQGVFECPECKMPCSYPLKLEIKTYPVYLFPHNKLYRCHTDMDSDDYKTPTGEVVQNKKDRGLWGIKNLSGAVWQCSFDGGPDRAVSPEGVVPVREGTQIRFQQIAGAITKEELQ